MHKILGLVVLGVLVVGCKDNPKAPSTEPVAPPSGTPETPASRFPLAQGESYFGGKLLATNLVAWKLPDGTFVQLGIVTTGKNANGREDAVLRAYHVGSETHDVGPKYSLDASIDHWSELKLLSNDRVMFRYGEAGKGPRARNGVLLRWDATKQRVVIAKHWTGTKDEAEPAWLMTGTYTAAPESEALCLKVIARMVSCEKDAKFRDAIFRRDDPAEKAAMQEHFDTHVVLWKKPAEAKAQCAKWAGPDYPATHFSEPKKLERLAAETKHDCGFFASEIVDEGGLPTKMTEA